MDNRLPGNLPDRSPTMCTSMRKRDDSNPPEFEDLVTDLKLIRLKGLGALRQLSLPALVSAAVASGHADDEASIDAPVIETLLREAMAKASSSARRNSESSASDDANRGEALRHVLRLVTASSQAQLPDASTVRSLAERQRIALTRDRAVDVQRAIDEGHRDLVSALRSASGNLRDLIDDSSKTAQAMIVAAVGIVALVARSSDSLPDWLLVMVAAAGIVGLVVLTTSRIGRIKDQKTEIRNLKTRLAKNPLIPAADIARGLEAVEQFDLSTRALRAYRTVAFLGLLAIAIVALSASWLVLSDPPAGSIEIEPSTSTSVLSPNP